MTRDAERLMRQERDGCDCPPQVERCAHMGSTVLTLASGRAADLSVPPHKKTNSWIPFVVGLSDKPRINCECGCALTFSRGSGKRKYSGNSEADALAAFHAAEEALLRGDDAATLVDKPGDMAPVPSDVAQIHQPATNGATPSEPPPAVKYCARCNGRMGYERTVTGDEWTCSVCGNVSYGSRFTPLDDVAYEKGQRRREPSHQGSRL